MKCLWLAKIPVTVSLFFFPLFSSQGLAAHGSCNSLRCCHCPPTSHKSRSSASFWGVTGPLILRGYLRSPLPGIVRLCKSNEPSLGAAWGACMSAHRSVPKSRRTGERQLDGLVWIHSWPGSEEGPAMRRESNRTSRVSWGLMVLLPSGVAGVGWILPPSPSAPPYKPGQIRGGLTTFVKTTWRG